MLSHFCSADICAVFLFKILCKINIYEENIQVIVSVRNVPYTVKPALRGHLWGKKWYFKTDDLLKDVLFI